MTSPLHGEDPGFKSPWAHPTLVTEIVPLTNNSMKIGLDNMENNAYSNFIDSIRNPETKRGYVRNLKRFLNLIPDDIFVKYLGMVPKSRELEDLTNAFIGIAKKDINVTKSLIRSYVKQIKQEVESGQISPNTVSNRLKPIKALFAANEIDMSWTIINKMFPRETKSEDRAYTREEISKMIKHCTDITDKVIILMFSSGGFRLESWDFFCWKDVVFFKDKANKYKGAALRVYRGDPEEYWTFVTPETCEALMLYREEWRSRFLRYPDENDPVVASTRFDRPVRLRQKGIRSRVDKIVTKIGLRDQSKKKQRRYEVKLDHGFRKYFNTMMRRAKVNYLDKEDMMGHKVGLEKNYERYQEEDFERFPEYQKAIPYLTISDEERLRFENQQKQDELEEVEKKNLELQDLAKRIDELENGPKARWNDFYKDLFKVQENPEKKITLMVFQMWFEMRATEEEKRDIWKKIQEAKRNGKTFDVSEFGESKGLSFDNLYSEK